MSRRSPWGRRSGCRWSPWIAGGRGVGGLRRVAATGRWLWSTGAALGPIWDQRMGPAWGAGLGLGPTWGGSGNRVGRLSAASVGASPPGTLAVERKPASFAHNTWGRRDRCGRPKGLSRVGETCVCPLQPQDHLFFPDNATTRHRADEKNGSQPSPIDGGLTPKLSEEGLRRANVTGPVATHSPTRAKARHTWNSQGWSSWQGASSEEAQSSQVQPTRSSTSKANCPCMAMPIQLRSPFAIGSPKPMPAVELERRPKSLWHLPNTQYRG